MAITAADFVANHPFFEGRAIGVVEHELANARSRFSEEACGALYDQIVEAQLVVLLLRHPTGLPTSKTKGSNLATEAQETLDDLMRRIPRRVGVVGGC